MSHLPYSISYHKTKGSKQNSLSAAVSAGYDESIPGIPQSKSFKRDILQGYLFFHPNQIIDLGEKRDFRGIYPCLCIRTFAAALTSRSPDTAAVPPPSNRNTSATSTPA